ncbi:hypothetical protein H8788_14530 [Parabacteroides faecis]|uniref:pyocin knob domain-containing protein n=1 Tax=Parabacteroides TaxID=375288 RepID=UPI001654FEA5|nr:MULTISPECIES: pyocin knob domain-containing protein [Parabacteroides]MBC8618959.1 hypothetical protein [Parabacteroides faecis]
MADNIDKALNGLDLKTDSLPNDWLITLINPKTGAPAQNMTVARFIELFTNKQPIVSENNNGLFSSTLFRRFSGMAYYIPQGDANTILNNLVLLGGVNRPSDDDFHYIIQIFYSGISSTSNRVQIALGYKTGLIHTRVYINNTFSDWKRFTAAIPSNYSLIPNDLTETIVEEVPVSADTPMTLEETGQPVPVTQTIERYEYSIPKMAEAILELQKQVVGMKA